MDSMNKALVSKSEGRSLSRAVGVIPCKHPNLIAEYHICLTSPKKQTIRLSRGPKDFLLGDDVQKEIADEIHARWTRLLVSHQRKRGFAKCLNILCLLALFGVPTARYFMQGCKADCLLATCAGTATVALLIFAITAYYLLSGLTLQFRHKLVNSALLGYVQDIAPHYRGRFEFTILYPITFLYGEQQTYSVLRISEGIVVGREVEPVLFSTSQILKDMQNEINQAAKAQMNRRKVSWTNTFTAWRSKTNPTILNRMGRETSVESVNLAQQPRYVSATILGLGPADFKEEKEEQPEILTQAKPAKPRASFAEEKRTSPTMSMTTP